MNVNNVSHLSANEKTALDLQDKLDRLLAKAKPGKREQVQRSFRNLYQRFEEHLALGKPLKEVVAAFNVLTQSNVCLRTFNDMLTKERERRTRDDDPVCCQACRQPLKPFASDDSTLARLNTSESSTLPLISVEQE